MVLQDGVDGSVEAHGAAWESHHFPHRGPLSLVSQQTRQLEPPTPPRQPTSTRQRRAIAAANRRLLRHPGSCASEGVRAGPSYDVTTRPAWTAKVGTPETTSGSVTTGSNHPAQLLLDPASPRDQGQHGQGGVEPAQLSPASPFRDLLACTAMAGRQLGRLGPGMRLPLDHHAGQGVGDAVNDLDGETTSRPS